MERGASAVRHHDGAAQRLEQDGLTAGARNPRESESSVTVDDSRDVALQVSQIHVPIAR
jgi:hypothetical protein